MNRIIDEDNGWIGSFTNLDEYTDGVRNVYTVRENAVSGYECFISDGDEYFVIKNIRATDETEVSGIKVWDDDNNKDGRRPDHIVIRLYADGSEAGRATVTAEDGWKFSFTNLPKYKDGSEILYTIREDAVDNYASSVMQNGDGSWTVTNTVEPVTETEETNSNSTTPTSGSSGGSSTAGDDESGAKGTVQTGDDFNMLGLMLSLAAIATLFLAGCGLSRKRKA